MGTRVGWLGQQRATASAFVLVLFGWVMAARGGTSASRRLLPLRRPNRLDSATGGGAGIGGFGGFQVDSTELQSQARSSAPA